MTRSEMIQILTGIARDEDANPTSRVTAIRALLEMAEESGEPRTSAFDGLDELASRRERQADAS